MAGEGNEQNEAGQRARDKARGITPRQRWEIDWGMRTPPADERGRGGGGKHRGGKGATMVAAPQGILTGGLLTAAGWVTGTVPPAGVLTAAAAVAAVGILVWAVAASRRPDAEEA